MQTFKTSLDNLAKGVTIAVTLFLAGIILLQYILFIDTSNVISLCTATTLLLMYFIAFALRPINYSISANHLTIHKIFWNVKINRNQIISVAYVTKETIGCTTRVFAVGGLFGYFGKFSNSKIGSITWYATRRNKTVLIKICNNKKNMVTPDDPETFVANYYA